MQKKAVAILLLATAAATVYAYRRAQGGAAMAAPEAAPDAAPTWWAQTVDTVDNLTSIENWIQNNAEETAQKVQDMNTIINTDANLAAFLEAISRAEGTDKASDPYRVCYGYKHTIKSFADHPAVLGEWRGEKLSDKLCSAAGLGPGCVSTAAGKFQITKSTWLGLKRKLGLADFGPESQNAAAVELLRQCGALDAARAGNVEAAVHSARRTWASLPGAGYEQPERSLAWLKTQYTNAGGVLA